MYVKNTLSAINIPVVLTLELNPHKSFLRGYCINEQDYHLHTTAHVRAPESGSNQIFIKVKFLKCVLISKCMCMCACTRLFSVYVMIM